MAKRRSRITYAPKSRRKSAGSDQNQSASSNAQETSVKEKALRSKPANESFSSDQEQGPRKKPREKRKQTDSDSTEKEAQSSPHKTLKSKRTEAESQVSPQKQRAVTVKKKVFQRKTQAKRDDGMPERIRDMTITRKTYTRWKPLSLSTKNYTKQTIENTVLSVLNSVHKESTKNEVQVHLKQLSERIAKKLDSIKGPTHKGDYSKMESESHELEDALISYNGQVEALEKELEEQRKLFEQDELMLNGYSDEGQREQSQLHPLLQAEPVNTLNLPSLSNEGHSMSTAYEIPAGLEGNGRRLAQSLAKLSDQTEKLGFTNWLNAVSQTTHSLLDS